MIVVDASVVVDLVVAPALAPTLRARLDGESLHAPALLDYEAISGLRGLVLGGHLSAMRADDAIADVSSLPIRRWPGAHELLRRAFQLRDNLTTYDASYVALAEALDCPLVTRDDRLARSVNHDATVEVW